MLYRSWIQWLFMAGRALTGNHYKKDIISSVGYPRSNSIVQLVLCIGVGIGRFQRKSEENFFDRIEVGKVGNLTDFTDRTH